MPKGHLDSLYDALISAGAGTIGNYTGVLSYSLVTGCWTALPGSNPYIGKAGEKSQAEEYKIEIRCDDDRLDDVLNAIKAAHPYEEPVINVIPLIGQ